LVSSHINVSCIQAKLDLEIKVTQIKNVDFTLIIVIGQKAISQESETKNGDCDKGVLD
jgi:hypothetical protein